MCGAVARWGSEGRERDRPPNSDAFASPQRPLFAVMFAGQSWLIRPHGRIRLALSNTPLWSFRKSALAHS